MGSPGNSSKMCDQSTAKNSTPQPQVGPKRTPSMDTPTLWCYNATGKFLGYFTANTRGTQAQDSTKSGHFPILCLRCGLYYAAIPQHNSRLTAKPNP